MIAPFQMQNKELCLPHSSLFLCSQHRIRREFAQQEHEHHEHHGADEFCAVLEGEVGAQQVAHDARQDDDGTGQGRNAAQLCTKPLAR